MSVNFKGDVDLIANAVRGAMPHIVISQLQVTHPADDDGIWYFHVATNPSDEIQIESSTGECPFLIENSKDHSRRTGDSVDEVVTAILKYFEVKH